jgi:aconitase A
MNVAQKLIHSHLVAGDLTPGADIALSVDQVLLQDVLGTLVMLELEAMGVALAMAGEPLHLKMPHVWGVRLTGRLPDWVSAKDVVLEMLRRHGVEGGLGRIIEYYGPGLDGLSAMDRHVIANMGAELGATTSVFPSDDATRQYLRDEVREQDWLEIRRDEGATYDFDDLIDLSKLEPLIAKPSSPGNVVPVREVAGQEIYQAYIGSSANPGYRDFAMCALMVRGQQVHDRVSFDINPSSREILENLIADGLLQDLVRAGARIHQAGCNGCIRMGQAPASGRNSLRTVPRNFSGRSGAKEDSVFLCSPETATASALTGRITDPRDLGVAYPQVVRPERPIINTHTFVPPLAENEARAVTLEKTPNITAIPELEAIPDELALPVLLKVGDDISTDDIMPAGARVMPHWSNIPRTSEFTFEPIDPTYPRRARETQVGNGHTIVAGNNYGQGSSRENAALGSDQHPGRARCARDDQATRGLDWRPHVRPPPRTVGASSGPLADGRRHQLVATAARGEGVASSRVRAISAAKFAKPSSGTALSPASVSQTNIGRRCLCLVAPLGLNSSKPTIKETLGGGAHANATVAWPVHQRLRPVPLFRTLAAMLAAMATRVAHQSRAPREDVIKV